MADTGDLSGTVDLSLFAGQTVYLRFVRDIPGSNTSPGVFQLDHISITDESNTIHTAP